MKRPRFTIASLLVLVLFLALGLAALRGATDLWDSGVLGVTLALLAVSLLLAVHRTGPGRAYWLGFALFGCGYLCLSLAPSIEARLPTSRALAYLDSKVSDRVVSYTIAYSTASANGNTGMPLQAFAFSPAVNTTVSNQAATMQIWNASTGRLLGWQGGTAENFVRIGHSLLALMLAFLGAHFSRHLHASKQLERPEETGVDAPTGEFVAG
jgi:hypothetical protein